MTDGQTDERTRTEANALEPDMHDNGAAIYMAAVYSVDHSRATKQRLMLSCTITAQ